MGCCAGGCYTSKVNGGKQVYRVDDQGAKTLVYEIDQSGQTPIHDAQDPMAKRHVAAQEMAEQIQAKKAAPLEALSAALKRQPEDPIYVSLAPPVLGGKMQRAEKSKGAVAQQILEELRMYATMSLIFGSVTSGENRVGYSKWPFSEAAASKDRSNCLGCQAC